jgi:hypothetical protein
MPFGKKPTSAGTLIDFDEVYRRMIAPAIADAGLSAIRADEELTGGIIHKPMFERLVLCEFAVADLTTGNANVFYELGVRHAARPHSTVPIFAGSSRLPFDVALLRALPYAVDAQGLPDRPEETRAALTRLLRHARTSPDRDSPLYQLLEDFPDIQREKTDVFRDRVRIQEAVKQSLARARTIGKKEGGKAGRAAVAAVEEGLGELGDLEAGVLVDLVLSYRAVSAWEDMIRLVEAVPGPVRETVLVQEQYAFGLNRAGRGEDAERVLREILDRKGPSSETYGLLGRVYKDRWEAALGRGDAFAAAGILDAAIDAYRLGFEADWRDAYPGINAVTLMEVRDPPDPRREELIPVVRYAAERRVASGKPDYWDHATLLEAAVLSGDEGATRTAAGRALALIREPWEAETTARNLRLIREARERRGEPTGWIREVEEALARASATPDPDRSR